jgi:hypothetical protein
MPATAQDGVRGGRHVAGVRARRWRTDAGRVLGGHRRSPADGPGTRRCDRGPAWSLALRDEGAGGPLLARRVVPGQHDLRPCRGCRVAGDGARPTERRGTRPVGGRRETERWPTLCRRNRTSWSVGRQRVEGDERVAGREAHSSSCPGHADSSRRASAQQGPTRTGSVAGHRSDGTNGMGGSSGQPRGAARSAGGGGRGSMPRPAGVAGTPTSRLSSAPTATPAAAPPMTSRGA